MGWLLVVLAVLVLGVAAVASTGRLGEQAQYGDQDIFSSRQGPQMLSAQDVAEVRIGVAIRGYAIQQVDDLLSRLAREIAIRDELLASARFGVAEPDVEIIPPRPPQSSALSTNAE